jgi:peptide/nickel transport system substrate-binding protein
MEMKRVLSILFLMFAVSLLVFAGGQREGASTKTAVTAAKAGQEPPMLAERVKKGELPPLSDRLPKEPKIANEMPADQLKYVIGRYGGTIRTATASLNTDALVFTMTNEPLLNTPGALGKEVTGNILKGYSVSADQKEFTFQMREGLKWSDGKPVTTEDIRFAIEDVLMDKEITPVFPQWLNARNKAKGAPMKLEIQGQYAFKIKFEEPYGGFLIALSIMGWRGHTDLLKPAHYLKQFHKKYVAEDKLKALIQANKVETWVQLYTLMEITNWETQIPQAIGYPQLTPWIAVSVGNDSAMYERNPYYFKVDSAGNQLPYIDKMQSNLVPDQQMMNMKQLAGEIDVAITALVNVALFKEAEKKGAIQLLPAVNHVSPTNLFLNLTYNDPTWRKVVGDKRFRQALSMAIDRKETIDALYYGLAEFPQGEYSKYDPAASNRLLDAMGLDKRDAKGYRLGPDGKTFVVNIEIALQSQTPEQKSATELFVQYFEKVGIRTTMKIIDNALFSQRRDANELQATVYWATTELWYFNDLGQPYWGPLWVRWWNTTGKEGEEPPADVKVIYEKIDSISAVSLADGLKAYADVEKLLAENTFFIMHVSKAKRLQVFNAKLANIPESASFGIATTFQAEQLFYKQ